jgi:uncharacterized UBP type Zn finger protein
MYRDLLSADVEELGTQIDAVNQEVKDALMGEVAKCPQSEAFPLHSQVEYTGSAKEKYGDKGEVIGYCLDCRQVPCVRVQFAQSSKIVAIVPKTLKLVA